MGLKLENTQLDQLGKARRVVVAKDDDDDHRRRRRQVADRGPDQPDPLRDREHRLRLRPGEAPGAPGEAGRRRRGRQGRRRHRDRDEGEEAPRRGRAAGHPGRPRRGHRPRRRRRAAERPGRGRPRRLDADEATGRRSSASALEEPIRQISENSGFEGSVVVDKVRDMKPGEGLNAGTGEYGDLIAAGVIDPTMVTRSALQNAASIAKNILTTEASSPSRPRRRRRRMRRRHARHGRDDVMPRSARSRRVASGPRSGRSSQRPGPRPGPAAFGQPAEHGPPSARGSTPSARTSASPRASGHRHLHQLRLLPGREGALAHQARASQPRAHEGQRHVHQRPRRPAAR